MITMDNNNEEMSKKYNNILTLSLIVAGLAIGFASYSTNLVVQKYNNYELARGVLEMSFVSNTGNDIVTPITYNGAEGDNAYINNTGNPIITGLNARFKHPGESVVYDFNVKNTGTYDAYIKEIIFSNINPTSFKQCTSPDGASEEMIQDICNSVNIKVNVDNIETDKTLKAFGETLKPDDSHKVRITISYDEGSNEYPYTFEIKFGNIEFIYDTIKSGENEG